MSEDLQPAGGAMPEPGPMPEAASPAPAQPLSVTPVLYAAVDAMDDYPGGRGGMGVQSLPAVPGAPSLIAQAPPALYPIGVMPELADMATLGAAPGALT